MRCQPGSRFQYGLSIDVLGRVVEILGRAPLDVVLKKKVFEPLGMTTTAFVTSAETAQKHLATLYELPEDPKGSPKVLDDPGSPEGSQWAEPRGAAPILGGGGGVETLRGGLLGSLSDYMRFAHMLLGKGQLDGVRILKESTVELMTEVNHLAVVTGDPAASICQGEGFGLLGSIHLPCAAKAKDLGHIPSAYGWGGWASTMFRVIPTSEIAVVFMTNCIGAEYDKVLLQRLGQAIRHGEAKLQRNPWRVFLAFFGRCEPTAPAVSYIGTLALVAMISAAIFGLAAGRARAAPAKRH